jgi:hypothetical protein
VQKVRCVVGICNGKVRKVELFLCLTEYNILKIYPLIKCCAMIM